MSSFSFGPNTSHCRFKETALGLMQWVVACGAFYGVCSTAGISVANGKWESDVYRGATKPRWFKTEETPPGFLAWARGEMEEDSNEGALEILDCALISFARMRKDNRVIFGDWVSLETWSWSLCDFGCGMPEEPMYRILWRRRFGVGPTHGGQES